MEPNRKKLIPVGMVANFNDLVNCAVRSQPDVLIKMMYFGIPGVVVLQLRYSQMAHFELDYHAVFIDMTIEKMRRLARAAVRVGIHLLLASFLRLE